VFGSIIAIVICSLVLVGMLHGSIEAPLFGKIFIALLILYASIGVVLSPVAIGTMNKGIMLKYFPGRYRVVPWTGIRFLKRGGTFGRYLIIKRSRFLDLWPVYFDIPPTTGPRQLELIDRLIAVICQHAGLSPKRKTIWGYDVYMRDEQ